MFTTLSTIMHRRPEAHIEVYIDDLPIEVHCDRDGTLVELMTDGMLDVKESFAQRLGLEVADGKTCVAPPTH